jgi:hypothetical protein
LSVYEALEDILAVPVSIGHNLCCLVILVDVVDLSVLSTAQHVRFSTQRPSYDSTPRPQLANALYLQFQEVAVDIWRSGNQLGAPDKDGFPKTIMKSSPPRRLAERSRTSGSSRNSKGLYMVLRPIDPGYGTVDRSRGPGRCGTLPDASPT